MRVVLGAVLAALLLAGCSPADTPAVTSPGVDVATRELRDFKATTGIADCEKQTADVAEGGFADVVLPCLGGGPDVAMARLRGPLVVNLWAHWCPPCQRELPVYELFHRVHGDTVGVLGVDWQDTRPGAALQMAAQAGVTYPLVADPAPVIRNQALPRLLLLDADGAIAFSAYVEITDLAQLEALVEQHLGVRLG